MAKERKLNRIVYQCEPCEDPSKLLESWKSEILKIGGSAMGIPKLPNFGSEQWMIDPEGNLFLILLPYLSKGSEMEAVM